MPFAGAMLYLKHHPEQDDPDLYLASNVLKYESVECLIPLALLDCFRTDPRFVFQTFFVVKPKKFIVDAAVHETGLEWHNADWRVRLLLCILAIILIVAAAAQLDGPPASLPIRRTLYHGLVCELARSAVDRTGCTGDADHRNPDLGGAADEHCFCLAARSGV
jgi:hypothetical protein